MERSDFEPAAFAHLVGASHVFADGGGIEAGGFARLGDLGGGGDVERSFADLQRAALLIQRIHFSMKGNMARGFPFTLTCGWRRVVGCVEVEDAACGCEARNQAEYE